MARSQTSNLAIIESVTLIIRLTSHKLSVYLWRTVSVVAFKAISVHLYKIDLFALSPSVFLDPLLFLSISSAGRPSSKIMMCSVIRFCEL